MAQLETVPLVLSAKRRNFRDADPGAEEADAAFARIRSSIRERDKFTCRSCGFHTKRGAVNGHSYLQVHHRDDDHGNNDPSNLVTLCMHCHAPFHIGFWGEKREAVIVYLPEMQQWQVSHLCRLRLVAERFKNRREVELMTATSNGGRSLYTRQGENQSANVTHVHQQAKSARKIDETIRALFNKVQCRSEQAQELLHTCDPAELANVLTQLPEEAYRQRHESLRHFRLLLTGEHQQEGKAYMTDIVDDWLEKGGPFAAILPTDWAKLIPRQIASVQ